MSRPGAAAAQVAFVTAASFGIGAATALALASDGFDIAVSATRTGILKNAAAKLRATGRRVAEVALDLLSQASVEQAFAEAVSALGRVDTPSPSRAATGSDPEYMRAMVNRIPVRRFATADDVAQAVCYLAGARGAFVTGHTLVIDGGLTAY